MQRFPLRTLILCTLLLVAPTLASAATPSADMNARVQDRLAARRAAHTSTAFTTRIQKALLHRAAPPADDLQARIAARLRERTAQSSSSSFSPSSTSASRRSHRSESSARNTSDVAQGVLDLVNAERATEGLAALTWNPLLQQSAAKHAQDMREHDYFSHTNLSGNSATQRIKAEGYPEERCNCKTYYGENIARGQITPEQVMRDWMNSPGHRDNILSPNFKEIGIALSGTYWVQNFGGVWEQ